MHTTKQASSALVRRILTMTLASLKRLSPAAAAARQSGKVPVYLTGQGGTAFGVTALRGVSGMRPTMTQHLTRLVRDAGKPKSTWNGMFWHMKPGQGDQLAAKRIGEVLARQQQRRAGYW